LKVGGGKRNQRKKEIKKKGKRLYDRKLFRQSTAGRREGARMEETGRAADRRRLYAVKRRKKEGTANQGGPPPWGAKEARKQGAALSGKTMRRKVVRLLGEQCVGK